jgi:hypothetical protein
MANQVQTQPYTDLSLLECSRRASVDVSGGNDTNNAIFMNKVNEGMMLNVGDKVSVHSAVIAEIGAGSDTIELKGSIISDVIIPNIIKSTTYNVRSQFQDTGYFNVLNNFDAVEVDKYSASAVLQDNNVHLTIQYYKATNGENCFSLPRRYGASNNTTTKPAYSFFDSKTAGATIQQPRNGTVVESDYSRDRNASSIWTASWATNRELLKIRQDGTKFTLFTRALTTYYNPNTSVPNAPTMQFNANGNGSLDPAVSTYYLYRELKSITIPSGRRSADFVAETFTNGLQNASNIQQYQQWNLGQTPSANEQFSLQGVLGAIYKTDTYKPFNCANGVFSSYNYDQARTYKYPTTGSPLTQHLQWLNSFQNVCFKRPDFVESGRQDWGNTFFYGGTFYNYIDNISNDNISGRLKARISFNVPYNKQNCEKLARWIKTQGLYPEFWDFRNASGVYHNNSPRLTSDNSRFLHLDMLQAYENSSKTLCSDRKEFGSDMNASTTVLAQAIKYNTPSEPLFVTYIKADENTFYDTPVYENDTKKLSYGIFLEDSKKFIQITTEGVGGIPTKYYNASGFFIGGYAAVGNASYGLAKYKRHIGYDPHFTAYGNAAIGLYTPSASGTTEKEGNTQIGFMLNNANGSAYDPSAIVDKGETINQVYLGSSNPTLTYDNIKDRFGFTDFYTPEFLGNDGGAGADTDKNPVRDGSANVYKINKRLRRQNYSPGMQPYPEKQSITFFNTDGTRIATPVAVDMPNVNIYPFSIMDCQSGISIENFGITEKQWHNSLMGILGFSYNQLQSPLTAENTTQQRVNTFNQKALNKVTTQAVVKAQDTLIFNMNVWGGEMYHPNISTSLIIHDHKAGAKKFFPYSNPIVQDTSSLIITAEGVPRQMLAPFYTIRSDIIDEAVYFGSLDSGERLPVIAHVLKTTDGGDFFYSSDSSLEFTITRQKPLSTITTAITDPDGTFSRVDDNSAVIYKIQRQNQFPVNLLATLFGNQK